MAKHTPGPWWWDGAPGQSNLRCGDPSECESDSSVIRYEPYEGMWLSRYGSADEDAANAKLIAAAPDLLEALRWYVENDDTNVQQDGNEFYTAGLRRAEAAIAKATGEQ